MNLQLPLLLGHKSNVLFESFVAAHGISETEHLTTTKWLETQRKIANKILQQVSNATCGYKWYYNASN